MQCISPLFFAFFSVPREQEHTPCLKIFMIVMIAVINDKDDDGDGDGDSDGDGDGDGEANR